MKNNPTRRKWFMLLLTLSIALIAQSSVLALQSGVNQQTSQTQQPQQPGTQPAAAPQDPIQQLNLTPEQRRQIRSVREQTKDERAAINQRVVETRKALDEALNATNPNEAIIDQRAREAGEAQAAAVRMRALMQSRIQRVLTPEQVIKLRQLQAEVKGNKKEKRQENPPNQGKPGNADRRALQNQRNGVAPGAGVRRNGLPRKRRL